MRVNSPQLPDPVVFVCATKVGLSPASASVTVRAPETVRTVPESSSTEPARSPPITSASFTPVNVTVTICSVPPAATAAKVSTAFTLLPSACTAICELSAV